MLTPAELLRDLDLAECGRGAVGGALSRLIGGAALVFDQAT